VRLLGAMGARAELWQLYQKEQSVDVKRQLLQSFGISGDSTRLIEIANSETNPDLSVRRYGRSESRVEAATRCWRSTRARRIRT
jgi:hypothetical protein